MLQVRPALVNVMVRAAEKAARSLRRDFGEVEQLQISRKGPGDFVSQADINAQNIIQEELKKARPDFGFLMEEGVDIPGKGGRWIVDPLDGTTNFLHGIPHWAISIAAEVNGEITAGVIYDPSKEEMFWAEKGAGAFGSRSRLRVSARKDLIDCVVTTGIHRRGLNATSFFKNLENIIPQVSGIRRSGSAALDMAYVAAGRYDAYYEVGISAWDIAAGVIIVKEAGGVVSPLTPKGDFLKGAGIVATNIEIHQQFLQLVQ